MKIDSGQLSPRQLASLLKGVNVRATRHGVVIQKWPRGRGGKATERERQNRARFGLAARMASNPIWLDRGTAEEMAKGTQQVPRDILTMAAMGNYYVIRRPDGTIYERLQSPIYVPPEPDPPPPPDPGSIWDREKMLWTHYDSAWDSAYDTSSFCFKGTRIEPDETFDIDGGATILNRVATAQYKMIIAEINFFGSIVSTVESTATTATIAGQGLLQFDITATLTAGTSYAILVGRTNSSATYALPIAVNNPPSWLFPVDPSNWVRIANTAPGPGNILSFVSSPNSPVIGLSLA